MIRLLVGPIACGKSTIAKQCADCGYIIINDDAIVLAVHGGNYSLYDKQLKPLYKSLENHIISVSVALGRDVIVDRPNYSKQMRSRYIALAKSLDVPVECTLFEWTSPELSAKKRFEKDARGKTYEEWLEAAKRHYSLYEPPSLDEGFDRIWKY